MQDRILHNGPDYVVMNKPAGVPSVPTVDNVREDLLACTAQVQHPIGPLPLQCLPCFCVQIAVHNMLPSRGPPVFHVHFDVQMHDVLPIHLHASDLMKLRWVAHGVIMRAMHVGMCCLVA